MQPLILFFQLCILYVHPLDFNYFLILSQYLLFICFDYLWRKIFNLEIVNYLLILSEIEGFHYVYTYDIEEYSDNDESEIYSYSDNEESEIYLYSDNEDLENEDFEDQLICYEELDITTDDNQTNLISDSEIDKENPFDYPEDEYEFYTLNLSND